MKFQKAIFDNKPALTNIEGRVVRINFDVEESDTVIDNANGENSDEEPVTKTVYEAYVVRVEQPVTYDRVVSAIINEAYSQDEMQAIINNHILADEDTDHETEFNEMQQWRKHAKEIARLVVYGEDGE